ncbi:MAG: mannose-1-phosphate guanylyltransferase [Ardenticatenaceae bacterium]
MNNNLYALILAGGVGSRLWPRSRKKMPKQMQDLTGARTMLQQTVDRIRELIPPENVWVMTNAEYVDLVCSQLPELPRENVVGEPSPRGTAPAIGLGAQYVAKRDPQGIMFALHADHYIPDEAGFRRAMQAAAGVAQEGWLVNLGVTPLRPETGYGYVELGESVGHFAEQSAYRVLRFREKPNAETAQQYVESGRFLWNSGIFCWRTDVIQSEFEKHLPAIQQTLRQIGSSLQTPSAQDALLSQWAKLEGETTIDRGIMERAERVATVPMDVGWNDVGAWDSLAALTPKDSFGNSTTGTGETMVLDSENVFVHTKDKLVAVVGVKDLIVVDTGDALLVMSPDQAQKVKQIVKRLRREGRTDLL